MCAREVQENIERKVSNDLLFEGVRDSIILLHGVFEPSVFGILAPQNPGDLFVMEGRPSLESAQATCRQLVRRKIKPTLIADSMAGFLFYRDLVKEVWLAYQTVDDEGALCPVGGLILGVLAKRHSVPVYVYPASQESRLLGQQKDIFYFKGIKVAPQNIKGYVPLIEWLPKKYITEIYN